MSDDGREDKVPDIQQTVNLPSSLLLLQMHHPVCVLAVKTVQDTPWMQTQSKSYQHLSSCRLETSARGCSRASLVLDAADGDVGDHIKSINT